MITDSRGTLGVIDDRDIPFEIKRVFWITDVPPGAVQGNHSHRKCEQVIICLSGCFVAQLNDEIYRLTGDSDALYVPANTHIALSDFSSDAVCLVLCSEYYDASDVYQP